MGFLVSNIYMKNPKSILLKHSCIPCDFSTSHKNDFIRHLSTDKHKRKLVETVGNYKSPIITPLHICSICNKEYKSKSGLWKHGKLCKKNIEIEDVSMNIIDTNKLLKIVLKQQDELNSKNNEILKLHKQKNIVNNTNNISINIFLNEHCKDAMNLTDFVDNLKLSLEDLNYTGKHGYTKGLANILIKNLGDIDPTERPIHCTDKKRMQFYIKDEDKWEKDENNNKIDKSIKAVTSKQYVCIKEWEKMNKGYETSGEKIDDFFKLTSNCTPDEENCNIKVMKRVADSIQIKEAMSNL